VGPGPCLWAGIPPSVAPRPAQSMGRVRRSSHLPPYPFAFSVFASILSFLLPSFLPSFPSYFFLLSFIRPPWCGSAFVTSPPHHWRLHHFTSASLEATSLHLRIIGGCTTSPPHHGRLHHFTSASLEAASSAPQSIIWGIIFRLLRRSDLSKLRQSVLIGERAYQSNHSISHEWAYQSDHSTSLLQHADRVLAAPIGPPLFPAAGPAGAAATLLAPSAPSSVNGRSPAPPTRRALEASSVHLRILGCLVRPPPHHWRLPRSTPASLWLRHPPCDRSLGPRPLLAPSARPDRLHQSVLVIGRNVSG